MPVLPENPIFVIKRLSKASNNKMAVEYLRRFYFVLNRSYYIIDVGFSSGIEILYKSDISSWLA